jgi:hypothetical protein
VQIDAPHQNRRALLHDDLDADVPTRAIDARDARSRSVITFRPVVALDSLEVALEHVAVEDLVLVEHALKHAQKLGRFLACDVALKLVVVELMVARELDFIERVTLMGNTCTAGD